MAGRGLVNPSVACIFMTIFCAQHFKARGSSNGPDTQCARLRRNSQGKYFLGTSGTFPARGAGGRRGAY